MPTEKPIYQVYLLRLWPASVSQTGPTAWRASLENPHTGERLGFASLEQLFTYLMEQVENDGRTKSDFLSDKQT
jgi:hypothetical protein